jgi:hypothetical protein
MKYIASVIGLIATLFFAVCAGTLFGGIASWVVNLPFPQVGQTLNTLTGLHLDAFDQGAVLGFVGGFLRSNSSK